MKAVYYDYKGRYLDTVKKSSLSKKNQQNESN